MKPIPLLLLLFFPFTLWAQGPAPKIILKGQVVDSASLMGMNATVTLAAATRLSAGATGQGAAGQQVTGQGAAAQGATLTSMATGADGSFEIEALADRAYVLHLTAVGYRASVIPVAATKGSALSKESTLDLGKITLAPAEAALQGAVVTASRHVVKQEIDRISYDVQADPDSKANDALEMLRKVPMVTVDANDVVQLKGSNNFQIFINGKPSALMVASPSDVLKAMPAATIQKIEVITVPPSKYDGEGLTGIINIITLKSTTDGVNGSLFARYNSVFGERASVSLNVSEGRLSLTGLLGLGRQPTIGNSLGSQLTNYSPASVLSQQGQKSEGGNFNNGKVDLSYEVDSSSLLTAGADFFNRRFNQLTSTFSELVYAPDSLAQSYHLQNAGPFNAGALDASVGYQLKYGRSKEGSLNLSYRYASTTNSQGNAVTVSDGYNYSGNDYTQTNHLQTKAHNFELGLIQPRGPLEIEAGAKAILGTNDSYFSDESEINDFNYRQNVYSGYNSYHLKLPGWELKGGLRLENTVINSSFSQQTAPIDQNYLNLLPTLSVQRNLTANSSVTLGFTQRIQRALAGQLNPFVDKSNPAFIVTGNPALRPVVNNIVQLDYSRSARLSVNASLDYALSENPIQNVTELISDTVSESTYENVGKNQTVGVHLTLNYPLFSKLNLILNTQLSHVWITGTYNTQFYQNDGTKGNAAASARYSFAHQLTASIAFNYKSGDVYLQGRSSNYTYVGFNLIKEFLQRRATLSITAFSPWSKFSKYSSSTATPDFEQNSYSQFYNRNFRLAFNYKFGRFRRGGGGAKGEEE
jgi:outer membrane receptor for ferrienterochelin and colicin